MVPGKAADAGIILSGPDAGQRGVVLVVIIDQFAVKEFIETVSP